MEESSIRWGELIGGLLIVGGSIALVVSLWSEIAARPFMKFSIFIGVTTALFGLGFYSAHRWKLPTTSRGALIISTLLAPLNFLAMTKFSHETVSASLPVIGGELFSLALFFFLVYQAARVFAPGAPWMTALATMGPSFTMLMTRHSSGAQEGWGRVAMLGVAPLFCYLVSCGVILRAPFRKPESDDRDADQIFTHLGVASFAALLPLGLLFIKPGYVSQTLRQFAPLISLFGIPAIATGVALLQGADENQSGRTRTAAMSVGIVGSMISMVAVIYAWPNAVAVAISAAINCAVCLAIAMASSGQKLRYDFRLAHVVAIAHFSLAFLTVSNLFSGDAPSLSENGPRLAESFVSQTSGVALASLFALFAAASELWLKKGRKHESRIYGVGSVVAGSFSVLLVSAHGFGRAGDPHHAALGYAFFAFAAFAVAWRREIMEAGWIGSALLFLTVLQTMAYKFGAELRPYHPVRLSVIVFANAVVVAAVIARLYSERASKLFAGTFSLSALIASMAVAPFLIFEGWMKTGQISSRMLWLAAIWFVIACLRRSPVLFAVFQFGLATSLTFGVAAFFGHQFPQSFLGDLRTLQAQAVALALLSLAWIAVRLAFKRLGVTPEIAELRNGENEAASRLFDPGVAAKLLYPEWPAVDRVVTLLMLAFMVGVSFLGAHAGMNEGLFLGPPSIESRNLASTALGAGSWLLLLALSLVFLAGLWERFEKRAALAMLILLACACLLIAGRWQGSGLTPVIHRWLSAIAFAAVASLIVFRARLAQSLRQIGWPRFDEGAKGLTEMLRWSSVALFVAPILYLTLFGFLRAVSTPPVIHSFVKQAAEIAALIGPLMVTSLSFIAVAAREGSAAYACGAGALVNLSVTLGYLIAVNPAESGIDRTDLYTIAQLNIITTSLCSLVWMVFHRRQSALGSAWLRSEPFLKTQTGLALFSALALLALADVRLFVDPWTNSALAQSFGGPFGVLAVSLSALGYAWVRGIGLRGLRADQFGAGLLIVGSLLVCVVSRFATDGWVAYWALMLTLNAAAWLMLAIRRDKSSTETWTATLAAVTGMMILQGVSSPGEPWWTVSSSISICLLLAALSLICRRRGYIYFAAVAVNYATSRVFLWTEPEPPDLLIGFLDVNAIALALPSIAWLAMHLRQTGDGASPSRIVPFHRAAARISIGLLIAILLLRWWLVAGGFSQPTSGVVLNWLALASVVAFFVACLWDEDSGYALHGLYAAGLITAGMALRSFNSSSQARMVSVVVILSLYTLAISVLWRSRKSLARLASRLKMPPGDDTAARSSTWIHVVNVLSGSAAYVITIVIGLTFDSLPQRLIAATVSFAIPISMALLEGVPGEQRLITKAGSGLGSGIQITNCIWMSLLSATLWGWSWLDPAWGLQAINRMAIVIVIAEAVLLGYRFIASRKLANENEWRLRLKAQLPVVACIGLAALIATLSAEASNYLSFDEAKMSWPVVVAVFVALISLFCACIAFALSPGRDPFDLSERGRMNYVYGAEALAVVTLLHARLAMPWLFAGFFRTWWPLIMMALAFTGVGLGELFRRRGRLVFAEPLDRTGILLPLLPVVGWWVVSSEISYPRLLFLVGLFYGVLSVMRRSLVFAALAVLAGNGGLWKLLDGVNGYGFYQHPQLWLIPVSLSVLAAARLNRDRLTQEQMTMTRYATLIMIYVSSTSDIFINGASESPWLIMALAVISVMGVAAGLMLRVRAFLFLGSAFLLLSVLTMIWTASVNFNWEWLWYVTLIAFGILIFSAAILFEKKRQELLELVARLKQWQA
jgi:hypothetical protein